MTAEFFAHANISAKSKQYEKIPKHINKGPGWIRIMKIGTKSSAAVPFIVTELTVKALYFLGLGGATLVSCP